MAPRMPPVACTPKTSSASSAPSRRFSPLTPHRQTTPASRPSTSAPPTPTKPHAGVIATRPATAPEAAPSIDGLPLVIHSPNIHDSTAAAVATSVLMNASAAMSPASSADPALNPNQPTHSSEAPIIVNVRLCGAIESRAVADPLAHHVGAHQAGHAGIDVHDGAAGEVERALLPQPSALGGLGCQRCRVLDARPGRARTRPCARSAGTRT